MVHVHEIIIRHLHIHLGNSTEKLKGNIGSSGSDGLASNDPLELCNGYFNCEGIYMSDIPVWFGQMFDWLLQGQINAVTYLTAKSWLISEGIINVISTLS